MSDLGMYVLKVKTVCAVTVFSLYRYLISKLNIV